MTATIHPNYLDDLECGKINLKGISRKSSLNLKEKQLRRYGEELDRDGLRVSSSCPSLSAELVESVMCDGQFRMMNERAHEASAWCGLISFIILGVVLIIVGLGMALSRI